MGKGGIWTIPREAIVKPRRENSGYEPDIIVLNQDVIGLEYQMATLTGNTPIVSPTFPPFNFSAQQIFSLVL